MRACRPLRAYSVFPASLADVPLRIHPDGFLHAARHCGNAEITVLLPVKVRGQFGQRAETRFTPGQRDFGELAFDDVEQGGDDPAAPVRRKFGKCCSPLRVSASGWPNQLSHLSRRGRRFLWTGEIPSRAFHIDEWNGFPIAPDGRGGSHRRKYCRRLASISMLVKTSSCTRLPPASPSTGRRPARISAASL